MTFLVQGGVEYFVAYALLAPHENALAREGLALPPCMGERARCDSQLRILLAEPGLESLPAARELARSQPGNGEIEA
jgi:hypothetical protein